VALKTAARLRFFFLSTGDHRALDAEAAAHGSSREKRKVPLPSVERLARHQRDIKLARPTRGEVEASARVIVALT